MGVLGPGTKTAEIYPTRSVFEGLMESGWENGDRIHLAQDRVQWNAVVNTIINSPSYTNSALETREYVRGDPLRWPRDKFYPLNLTLTSPTWGGPSVGIVILRTKNTEWWSLHKYEVHWTGDPPSPSQGRLFYMQLNTFSSFKFYPVGTGGDFSVGKAAEA
jgi:hypothetical protein